MVLLDAVKALALLPLGDEDWMLVQAADRGDAEAQNDVAMIFLEAKRAEGAIYWLELAALSDHPDALNWLARCYLDGNGVVENKHRGLMYLAKSAELGHSISRAQVDSWTRLRGLPTTSAKPSSGTS